MKNKMLVRVKERETEQVKARAFELLNYDRETGLFTWTAAYRGGAKTGKPACFKDATGYLLMHIDGERFRAHRIAWLMVTGNFPESFIDHVNGVRDDNRFSNLRDVANELNQQNQRRPHKDNAAGLLGVKKSKYGNTFEARIGFNYRVIHLGSFKTAEQAHQAYLEAKRKYHNGCTI